MAHSPVALDAPDDDLEAAAPADLAETPDLGEIAAYVWGRRLGFDLSTSELAELADVAVDVVVSIERGVDVDPGEEPQGPDAHDLADVLLALDASAGQVGEVLGDDAWAADVLTAMAAGASR